MYQPRHVCKVLMRMRLPLSLVQMVYDWRHFNRDHWTLTARRNWATSNTRHVIPLNVPKYAIWIVPTANTLSCRKRSQTRHLSRERSQTRHLCRNTTFWRDHHLCGRHIRRLDATTICVDVLTGISWSELKDGVGHVSINCSANADTKRGCGGTKSLCYGTVVVTYGPFLQHDSLFIPLTRKVLKIFLWFYCPAQEKRRAKSYH